MAGVRVPSASPYRTETNDEYATGDDSRLDLGAQHHHGQPQRAAISSEAQAAYDKANDYGPGRPQEYEDENAGYHPGVGPGQASNQRHSVHPA
ncbi:hypothetical protein LTR53_019541, partial [Teratosphaeriaceae sp. CCFEE 6253]